MEERFYTKCNSNAFSLFRRKVNFNIFSIVCACTQEKWAKDFGKEIKYDCHSLFSPDLDFKMRQHWQLYMHYAIVKNNVDVY